MLEGTALTLGDLAQQDYISAEQMSTLGEALQVMAEFYPVRITTISIPASWRHIPSPLYDESIYRANIAKCREIIAAQNRSDDPAQRVRNLLASHFDLARSGDSTGAPPPGLEAIAEAMHLTPRTLIRRLKRADNSYKQLLEEARRDCAEELLQLASLTVADVGDLLGYRDPANFGRAFRNWKGVTPAAWRRGLRNPD